MLSGCTKDGGRVSSSAPGNVYMLAVPVGLEGTAMMTTESAQVNGPVGWDVKFLNEKAEGNQG